MGVKDIVAGYETNYETEIWPQRWQVIKDRKNVSFESTHKRKNGEEYPVEINCTHVEFDGQEFLCAFSRDVSERKRAEKDLQESEEKYRNLVERAKDGIIIVQEGIVKFVNTPLADIFGYTVEEVIGTSFLDYVAQDEHPRILKIYKNRLKGEDVPEIYEMKGCRKDGQIIDIETNSGIITYDEKQATLSFIRDVTERNLANKALRESEEKYRTLVERANDGLIIFQEGIAKYANTRMAEIFGYKNEEIIGISFTDFIAPDERPKLMELYQKRVKGEDVPEIYELKGIRKDGRIIDIETNSGTITYNGQPATQSFIRDITERKQADDALRESEERYRRLVEHTFDGIIIHADGKIRFINNTGAKVLGAKKSKQIIGKHLFDILHPDYHEIATDRIKAVKPEFKYSEVKLVRLDGEIIDAEVMGLEITYDGKPAIQAVFRNIAERKLLEEQLSQAQKMEAVGTLAGGIAHDFNNLLAAILGYAELIKQSLPDGDKLRRYAVAVEKSAGDAASLTSQLLGFARKGKFEIKPVNINQTINNTEEILNRSLNKLVSIDTRLQENLWLTGGDPSQLQQIFINLGINAGDAMPGGGRLTYTTNNIVADEPFVADKAGMAPGNYVHINVTDTGEGIPRENLSRIFEPFYTTKEMGRGTGLGLASVYGTVDSHNGHIFVTSESGKGTAFDIYLPAIEEDAIPEETHPKVEAGAGNETILVVDDEESIRELATEMLSSLGYRVLIAADGLRAAKVYKEHMNDIDVVLLDMSMPEMDGRRTFRKLRQINPEVRVVLSSGFGRDRKIEDALAEGILGFVKKPYRIAELSAALRRVIDDR
jgi:PAS domain S-box-containing protein